MTQKPSFSIFYTASRIFWSIYFVFTIALVGFLMGYVVTLLLYTLATLFNSRKLFYAAEYVQCYSIRFLLQIQPWLDCDHNFQSIYGFYDEYKTRRVMFVSNHRSNLDTFLMISLIPGLRGLAKASLYYNIFFAPLMCVIGFVPVKKGDIGDFLQGLKGLKTKIFERDRAALVFPETTRCEKNFPSVHKFSASFFEVAIDSQAVVVPIFIRGTDRLFGRGDLFLNPFKNVGLERFESIAARDFNSGSELAKHCWQILADAQKKSLCS